MPHAVFNLGTLSATTEAVPRTLIPGIAPGGSRAGQEMKPALLIRDCWLELLDISAGVTDNFHQMSYYLKLSQESDMTPGLQLPIAAVSYWADGTHEQPACIEQMFRAQGTIWAPRNVGVRVVEVGAIGVDADIHLDYEQVDVPWMDWFIMWDFLDNVVDNEKEY